ncbi:MAG TPA: LysR substrate-binding domain-containing protein [Nocardioidaceae bacterium]|nr:LysR substrate-binding domain-containing protein [Nocardioidaceae bacterium]
MYRDAQHLLRQFDRLATNLVDGQHGVTGQVAVGLPSTAAVHLAPALYSWTKRNHPGVHLQLFESMSGYIQELLLRGRMDLAVLYRDDAAERPTETPLYSEELYLVGDPGVGGSGSDEVKLVDLDGVPIVAPGERSNLRALIERTFSRCGLIPNTVADVESLGAMIRITRGGDACAVLPLSSIEPLSEEAGQVRRIVDPVICRHVAVCTVAEFFRPRDAVETARRAIVEVTASLARSGAWRGIRVAR